MNAQDILGALRCDRPGCPCHAAASQGGGNTHCPAHADRTPSLAVSEDSGKTLIKCFAGCGQDEVLAALSQRGLWAARNGNDGGKPRIAATYDYRDEDGALLFQAVRMSPKSFKQRRPDGRGGWIWNLNDVQRVLYRLPDVIAAASAGGTVYVGEGEKDADRLTSLGLTATTNPQGAGKWRPEYSRALRGAHVVVLPDNDLPGRNHAQTVAASLHGIAASVRVLELAGLPPKGDVADWLDAGGTPGELELLAAEAPEWTPGAEGGRYEAGDGPHEEAADWPPRGPLPERLPPAPSLPEAMIPEVLRPWQLDIAERLAVPLEMVVVPAIVAAAGLVGRQVTIQPESYDDAWRVVPNIWGGVCAPPGFLKTPAIEQGFGPFFAIAKEAHEAFMADAPRHQAERIHLEMREANAKDAMRKASKSRDKYEEGAAIEEMASIMMLKESLPKERRYYTSDTTIEKLGELLRDNPRGILLHRDELAGWMLGMEREGRKSEREFFLEAWNGTGTHTVDRIARGTIHIPNMCLSLFGGIQPGKLSRWVRGATRGDEQADGLLQRLQLFVWPDNLGDWHKVEQWPDRDARERALAVYRALDYPRVAPSEGETPPCVRFDDGGQEVFDAWRRELETRTRSGELAARPAYASHIAKYRSLMPSLALLFELIACAARGEELVEVGRTAAELAANWCDFLEAHAVKLYAAETSPEAEGAHVLAEKILAGDVHDGITIREIYRPQWRGLASSDDVDAALAGLERAGWVRREVVRTGGAPSHRLRLHPELLSVQPGRNSRE